MIKLVSLLSLLLAAAHPVSSFGQTKTLEQDPAYLPIERALDLNTIRPEVNVNLPRFLLLDAAAGFDGGPNDPFAKAGINLAELIKDVKLIRVMIIEANETNQAALSRGVSALRETLNAQWMAIASVPESGVGIYALGDPSGEAMAGLAVLIHEAGDNDAIIANIVGRVPLAKVIQLVSRLDKFPKDLLQKLMQSPGTAGPGQPGEPSPAKEKASEK